MNKKRKFDKDEFLVKSIILVLIIAAIIIIIGLIIYKHKEKNAEKSISSSSANSTTQQLSTTAANNTNTDTISFATITDSQTEATTEAATEDFTISMNFVGDLLLATDDGKSYDGSFEQVAASEDPSYFLKNFNDMFLNDDITVGDCENVFSDSTNLTKKDKGQYDEANIDNPDFQAFWFKSESKNANILSAGGIDVVSIDNNHIDDYGTQGVEDTKAALEAAGVAWGNSSQIVYKEVNGFKIAFIFGSMYYGGAEAGMISLLEEANNNSDYQVVYFHGGTEAVHEAEAWKVSSCHNLVDHGADLVCGDHPHRIQRRETYNGVDIVYSLGNFCFGGNNHPENRTIVYSQTLNITKNNTDGTFTVNSVDTNITPCYVYTGETNNWQPAIIDDEEIADKVLEFMKGNTDSPL